MKNGLHSGTIPRMSEQSSAANPAKSAENAGKTVGNAVEIVDASQFGKSSGKSAEDNNGLSFTDDDMPKEIGGREGPEPTRFGDWEKNGRCIDF